MPLPWQLSRLLEYVNTFEKYKLDWSHLKHKEDFNEIYNLPTYARNSFDDLYAQGAQVCMLSSELSYFNYPDIYPTLTSFLSSQTMENISNSNYINYLFEILNMANKNIITLNEANIQVPWAIPQMTKLLSQQIELLKSIQYCLITLKQTDIYLRENEILKTNVSVEKILETINRTGKRFETLPATTTNAGEEDLRDQILLALSGITDITTYGEVFNKRGKTDILASENGVNKFIAECKIWHGEKLFLETISQLLSYLTWRDDSVAVIIFVKNQNFSSIVQTAKTAIREHGNDAQFIEEKDNTWLKYRFNNGNKNIDLSLMLYHIV